MPYISETLPPKKSSKRFNAHTRLKWRTPLHFLQSGSKWRHFVRGRGRLMLKRELRNKRNRTRRCSLPNGKDLGFSERRSQQMLDDMR